MRLPGPRRVVPPRVELQRTNGEEGGVGREAFVFGVEGGGELGELGRGRGRNAEGSVGKMWYRVVSVEACAEKEGGMLGFGLLGGTGFYIIARRTSPIGMAPSFSPSIGSEKRLNASRISDSSCALRLCSFASFDGRADEDAPPPPPPPPAAGRRRGGCTLC